MPGSSCCSSRKGGGPASPGRRQEGQPLPSSQLPALPEPMGRGRLTLARPGESVAGDVNLDAQRVSICPEHPQTQESDMCYSSRPTEDKSSGEAGQLAVLSYLDGIKGGHGVNHQASRLR